MGRKTLMFALSAAGLAMLLGRNSIYGISFIMTLMGAGCLFIAAMVGLTLPFKDQKLRIWARRLLAVILAICTLAGLSFIAVEYTIIKASRGDAREDADILIVLGAGLRGSTPSAVLSSRLRVTLDYMEDNPGCIAVLTGSQGPGETRTEASAMAEWLVSRGVDSSRLILEEEAHNTAQNVKYSLALLDEMGMEGDIMVVSSEFHLWRAQRIFARHGMDVSALPAPTPKIGLVPLNSYVREYFSIVLMGVKDIFGIDE